MWATRLIRCDACGGHIAAHWVDRWELVAGYYCDDCHKDYRVNSYLLSELNRKPHDAIISQSHAYLTDKPDFQGFNLFQPGRIAYLGASMGMGKTTAIFEQLPRHSPGKAGIVLVPRIALAQALATRYRYEYGHNAVGVFHEGSGQANRYIGTHGAIGCLSALPAIVRQAQEQSIDNLFIAIDELDFAYELKRLRPEYAPMIFHTLSQAVERHGIAVAGQTETLLSLESFVREIGRSEQDITAFYAHASPAPGEVHLVGYPQVERCTHTVRLHGLINAIKKHLSDGKRIYAFFSDRREVRTVEAIFADSQPVDYLRHHLERIAGMKIADTESLQSLKEIATAAKTQEREEVQHRATVFFNRNEILAESEIRRRSVSGSLDGADTNTLIKRRRGWIATRFPVRYAQIFATEKASALDVVVRYWAN